MKKENKVTVKTFKGTEVIVKYEHEEYLKTKTIYADGDNVECGKEVVIFDDYTIYINGKETKLSRSKINFEYQTGKTVEICRELGVDTIFETDEAIIIFDNEELAKINNMVEQTICEAQDEDVQKFINEENEKIKAIEIKEAKRIIEKAATTIKNKDGQLMSEKEKAEYIKKYNEKWNDGGEGYLPEIITRELFEHACKLYESNREEK